MALVTEYKCIDCGLELKDDGRVFIWDDESNRTKDFLILMMTCHWLNGAKIKGSVNVTYCSDCDKFLKIYSIEKVMKGIDNPSEVVMEGIRNYISECGSNLDELKSIKKRAKYTVTKENGYYDVEFLELEHANYSYESFPEMAKEEVIEDALNEFNEEIDEMIERHEETYKNYLNSNYLVIDNSNQKNDYDPLEKIRCPECGNEIYKYINGYVPCPRCGKELLCINCICYD